MCARSKERERSGSADEEILKHVCPFLLKERVTNRRHHRAEHVSRCRPLQRSRCRRRSAAGRSDFALSNREHARPGMGGPGQCIPGFVWTMSFDLRRIEGTRRLSNRKRRGGAASRDCPRHDVADGPAMFVQNAAECSAPTTVQQRFGFFRRAAVYVGPMPAVRENSVAARFGMRGNDRVARARRCSESSSSDAPGLSFIAVSMMLACLIVFPRDAFS